MYRRGRLGDPLVTIGDATLDMRDLFSLNREMLEGVSEREADEFRKNLSRIMGIRELEQPSCCYKSLSSFLSRIGGSMQPDRVLEGFTILARVMNFHRLKVEGWTNGHLRCLSERMVDFWVASASLPWAIKYGLPPDALIQCWKLVSERLRREDTKEGWWPLANEEWEDATSGGVGSYHLGPYSQFEIPKACQFGLSDESFPEWRIANALEEQQQWILDKLRKAMKAGNDPWNPLPVGIRCCDNGSYRSVFRGYVVASCHIGSPFRKGVWERSQARDLPTIGKNFELWALRDALSDVNARLTSLKEKVAAERKSDEELIEANVSFLGCMSHNFREIGV